MTRVVPAAVLSIALLGCPACGTKQEASRPDSRAATGERDHAAADRGGPSARSGAGLEVRVLPIIVRTGARLHLSASGFSHGNGKIVWTVDGAPVEGQEEDQFSTEGVRKGSSVQAHLTVGEEDIASNTVMVVNTPPAIQSVRIVPDVIRPGDSIGVEAEGSDADGDEVTFEYQWEKNGKEAGTGNRLEGTLHRGDVVSVRITPFDGEARGNYLVVRREVKNYPPSFQGVSDAKLENDVYTCSVGATDGDNDPLTYSLKKSPPGMTIDANTGRIRWNVPAEFTGSAAVTVSVTDGHGGEASYPMNVTLREESPKK